jgi:hypothetical protein
MERYLGQVRGDYPKYGDAFSGLVRSRRGISVGSVAASSAVPATRNSIYGYEFEGVRYDLGDRVSFISAQLGFGLKRNSIALVLRGSSSAGRALRSQPRGRGFKYLLLHISGAITDALGYQSARHERAGSTINRCHYPISITLARDFFGSQSVVEHLRLRGIKLDRLGGHILFKIFPALGAGDRHNVLAFLQ